MERCCCCVKLKDSVKYIGVWWIIVSAVSLANLFTWWAFVIPALGRIVPMVVWFQLQKEDSIDNRIRLKRAYLVNIVFIFVANLGVQLEYGIMENQKDGSFFKANGYNWSLSKYLWISLGISCLRTILRIYMYLVFRAYVEEARQVENSRRLRRASSNAS